MAEKDPEKDLYEHIDKHMKATKKYVAKIRDKEYDAIKKANEAIDYKFEDLDNEDVQDKYINKLSDEIRDNLKEVFGIEKDLDEMWLDSFIQNMGGLTYEEIRDIVKGKGSDFGSEDIIRKLKEKENRFAQRHYMGAANKYVTEKEHIKPAIKYLGLEDKVDLDKVELNHLPELFAYHGTTGLSDQHIPNKIRKSKKEARKEDS